MTLRRIDGIRFEHSKAVVQVQHGILPGCIRRGTVALWESSIRRIVLMFLKTWLCSSKVSICGEGLSFASLIEQQAFRLAEQRKKT